MCADNVVNSNIPCCGMAGDRGMRYPELTAASLQHLNVKVRKKSRKYMRSPQGHRRDLHAASGCANNPDVRHLVPSVQLSLMCDDGCLPAGLL